MTLLENLNIQVVVHTARQAYENFWLDELRQPGETNEQLLAMPDDVLVNRSANYLRQTQNSGLTSGELASVTVSRTPTGQWIVAPKTPYGD